MLLQIGLNFPFEQLEEFGYRLCLHQIVLLIIRVRKSIVLCPPFQASIPLFLIQKSCEVSLLFFRNKCWQIDQSFHYFFLSSLHILYMVTPYQESLKLLFNTWNKVYQISARIITNETRRNSLKKLQGNYRRFQREVEVNYQPEEEITVGLLRYYQVQAERQYKYIVNSNFPLTKTQSFRHINPWVQRMENFEKNRQNRAKVELSTFLHNPKEND